MSHLEVSSLSRVIYWILTPGVPGGPVFLSYFTIGGEAPSRAFVEFQVYWIGIILVVLFLFACLDREKIRTLRNQIWLSLSPARTILSLVMWYICIRLALL